VGDLVLRLRQDARGRHKLTHPSEGSVIIAKILKPGTYKLANSQGEVYSNAWNIRQLRRFTLKMFSSRSYTSFSLHTQKESNRQGRVSLASVKPDPPSGARRGGTPSASKFSSEKSSTKTTFMFPDYISNKTPRNE
jgi:hypothetical protein